jgi:alkanesulfonate monooxygenase SsuD/methylene tetrahydromethanopterin reductase-like flavin-dependent oxidoreductase (luciferase family)
VLLVPFHNPVRLAEDIAKVDIISGRRFELGAGVGFKREEFEGFGAPFKERGARTNQSLDIIRRALAGETVTFKSEFFDFQNVTVTPELIQKPRPPIWLGGFTPAALRRAVRFGDGFTVPEANRDVYDRYISELKKENRPTDGIRFASGFWCLIVSDENLRGGCRAHNLSGQQLLGMAICGRTSALFRASERSRATATERPSQGRRPRHRDQHDPELQHNVPITHFYSWTLPPGLPPRWAQTHLELFASKVIPAFR